MPAIQNPVASFAQSERVLGQSVLRREGAATFCGKTCYVDNQPRQDVWLGVTGQAGVPHAR